MGEICSYLLERPLLVAEYPHLVTTMPAPSSTSKAATASDMSVILVTGSYDHEIRFWEAWSGICSRTIARTGESGVRASLDTCNCSVHTLLLASKPPRDIPRVSYRSVPLFTSIY